MEENKGRIEMGKEYITIKCRSIEECKELHKAYITITRIRGYPKYFGYCYDNILHLEIID